MQAEPPPDLQGQAVAALQERALAAGWQMLASASTSQSTPRVTEALLYTPFKEFTTSDTTFDREPAQEARDGAAEQIAQQQQLLDALKQQEENLRYDLREIDAFWSTKSAKLKEELHKVRADLRINEREMAIMDSRAAASELNQVSVGPASFINGQAFNMACTGVIVLNCAALGIETKFPQWRHTTRFFDYPFLFWYCMELLLKAIVNGQRLFIGKFSKVVWNWFDCAVVIGGIIDEVVLPFTHGGISGSFGLSNLRVLRLARLYRTLRMLRLCKLFTSDMAWTEGNKFQSFIMGVVALNTVIMAAELDRPWDGWAHVEQVLLCIYVFELAVRLKRWRCLFFVHPQDWCWNYLDTIVVVGGVVDGWIMPLTYFVQNQLGHASHDDNREGNSFLKLIRIARLVRVLRLVRLLRAVKPLYKLLIGVLAAMQSIMWVIVLCLITLYAFAILTTHLLGRGIIFGGHPEEVPENIKNNFGSVLDSMFFLFKLMNDDQTVMNGAIHLIQAQILFVVFMVVSNWAILAILTSVMSEGMLSATQNDEDSDVRDERRKRRQLSVERLIHIFRCVDLNKDSFIDEMEFSNLMGDHAQRKALSEVSGLRDKDLEELFGHLSHEDGQGNSKIRYEEFVEKLQKQGTVVSQRSVFRVEKLLRIVERNLRQNVEAKIDDLMVAVGLQPRKDVVSQEEETLR